MGACGCELVRVSARAHARGQWRWKPCLPRIAHARTHKRAWPRWAGRRETRHGGAIFASAQARVRAHACWQCVQVRLLCARTRFRARVLLQVERRRRRRRRWRSLLGGACKEDPPRRRGRRGRSRGAGGYGGGKVDQVLARSMKGSSCLPPASLCEHSRETKRAHAPGV